VVEPMTLVVEVLGFKLSCSFFDFYVVFCN
jgi:hypothetical protein